MPITGTQQLLADAPASCVHCCLAGAHIWTVWRNFAAIRAPGLASLFCRATRRCCFATRRGADAVARAIPGAARRPLSLAARAFIVALEDRLPVLAQTSTAGLTAGCCLNCYGRSSLCVKDRAGDKSRTGIAGRFGTPAGHQPRQSEQISRRFHARAASAAGEPCLAKMKISGDAAQTVQSRILAGALRLLPCSGDGTGQGHQDGHASMGGLTRSPASAKGAWDKGFTVEVTPFSEWGIAYAALARAMWDLASADGLRRAGLLAAQQRTG